MPKLKSLTKGSLYALSWGWNRVFGHVGMLDLYNTNQVSSLFRSPLPKMLVFVHDDRDLDSPTGINWWLQPLAKKWGDRVKVYTATTKGGGNAWGNFGIVEGDLPIAVMHDTGTDRKMVMERGGTFGRDKVVKLLEDFIGGEGGDDEL